MSDPIGTVRVQHHIDGFSTWVHVEGAEGKTSWLCICGPWAGKQRIQVEPYWEITGAAPGTPAVAHSWK